jgi:hypothetical protein
MKQHAMQLSCIKKSQMKILEAFFRTQKIFEGHDDTAVQSIVDEKKFDWRQH